MCCCCFCKNINLWITLIKEMNEIKRKKFSKRKYFRKYNNNKIISFSWWHSDLKYFYTWTIKFAKLIDNMTSKWSRQNFREQCQSLGFLKMPFFLTRYEILNIFTITRKNFQRKILIINLCFVNVSSIYLIHLFSCKLQCEKKKF